jgi:hypothetical protein
LADDEANMVVKVQSLKAVWRVDISKATSANAGLPSGMFNMQQC